MALVAERHIHINRINNQQSTINNPQPQEQGHRYPEPQGLRQTPSQWNAGQR
jgi:hypothetical protein